MFVFWLCVWNVGMVAFGFVLGRVDARLVDKLRELDERLERARRGD